MTTNLAFLSAPWIARAGGRAPTKGTSRPRTPTHSAPSQGKATRAPSPRPPPRPSRRLGKPAPRSDDDDGGGAEVAGDVAFACCSAMVGAMAEAASAEDVDLEEERAASREPYPEYTDTPPLPPDPDPDGPAFSPDAAREAIALAEARSRVACAPPLGLADAVLVRVRFTPAGQADAVRFEPAWPDPGVDRCMTEAFLACEVPAFAGEAVTVKKTLEGPTTGSTTGSASPSP